MVIKDQILKWNPPNDVEALHEQIILLDSLAKLSFINMTQAPVTVCFFLLKLLNQLENRMTTWPQTCVYDTLSEKNIMIYLAKCSLKNVQE